MFTTQAPAILPHDLYVYAHIRATTGEIFYIGKGRQRRAWATSGRSQHWRRIAAKHGVVVSIIMSGLQEWAAHELECGLIALYGRRDTGYGPLINVTDGGEGTSGRRFGPYTIHKMSEAKKGRLQSAAAKAARQQAMNRPDVKEKLRAAQVGRVTERQLAASGATCVVCQETGQTFVSLGEAVRHLRGSGISTSAASVRRSCMTGNKMAGGYTWRYAE